MISLLTLVSFNTKRIVYKIREKLIKFAPKSFDANLLMKVNKELIEKYHLNLCTEEEQEIVEDWLLNDEFSEEFTLSANEDKYALKEEMWSSITAEIPSYQTKSKQIFITNNFTKKQLRTIAASLMIGLLCIGAVTWKNYFRSSDPLAAAELDKNKIDTKELSITLAPESKAQFNAIENRNRGNIDFCGAIMINPKMDVELTLNGQCVTNHSNKTIEIINLKKGNKYIAVNYRFNSENELIVVDEKNLMNLPPLLQREIMSQFNI